MSRVQSFPPIAAPDARVLILGSMPGVASLDAGQYYAHRQNAFWRILGTLLGFDPALPYAARQAALQAAGVAVWDVLASCVREGSLDASIDHDTVLPNDFPAFLVAHGGIGHVFFNGAVADTCFRRYVLPGLDAPALEFTRLPSTSPANASFSFERKLAAWRAILEPLA